MAIEYIDKLEFSFDPKIDPKSEIRKRVLAAYEKNRSFFGRSLDSSPAGIYPFRNMTYGVKTTRRHQPILNLRSKIP